MKRLEWERQKYRRRGSRMGKLQKWARQEWEWEGDREEDEEEGGGQEEQDYTADPTSEGTPACPASDPGAVLLTLPPCPSCCYCFPL